jgi:hypothetical protein
MIERNPGLAGRPRRIIAPEQQVNRMTAVAEETAVDYELTARIGTEAFASTEVSFSADRIKWLYERGFGAGTTVVAAFEDGRKVGQIALIGQKLRIEGGTEPAAQLIDLFVLQSHRSPALLRQIYRKAEQLCTERGIRYVLGLPNDRSVQLNARLFKLKPLLLLPIRAGVSLRQPRAKSLVYSGAVKDLPEQRALELLSGFAGPADADGPAWDGETLLNRLTDPTRDYAVHAVENLLLVSSSRRSRGVRHTLLCAFLARPEAHIRRGEAEQLVRAACRFWRLPVFVYAGVNNRLLKLPGLAMPERLRAPILVQFRDLADESYRPRFGRFELIDSDFA